LKTGNLRRLAEAVRFEIDDNKSGENDFHMFIREVGQLDDECSGDYKKTN